MKRLPNGVPLFFGLAVLAGCGPEEQAGSGQDTMAADTPVRAVPRPAADTTITISRIDGRIVVRPESLGIRTGRVVRWAAVDPDAVWMVLFADSTPMQNGVQVLHNTGPGNPDRAPVRREAAIGSEFKYWVFYPDGRGGYLQLDPKLVIIHDPGADTAQGQ